MLLRCGMLSFFGVPARCPLTGVPDIDLRPPTEGAGEGAASVL